MNERMTNIFRYLPELKPNRVKTQLERFWKRKINPPPERNVFISPEEFKIMTEKIEEVKTKPEPKQVSYSPETNSLLVSCMKGKTLQLFSLKGELKLTKEISFADQCVEVTTKGKLAFVTTTNFERPPRETHNHFYIIDIASREVLSSTETNGNWSKFIAVSPQMDQALVSNWHSHDISVINIENIQRPKVTQVIKWGESPRGIAITKDGKKAVLTGFYSGNIGLLELDKYGKWKVAYTSPPFDHPNYSGNPRHVILNNEDKIAYISNLGRNAIHLWSMEKRKFIDTILVGKSPNSIAFLTKQEKILAVSCRGANRIFFINTNQRKVIGTSDETGDKPTGLCSIPGNEIVITSFGTKTLSKLKLTEI